MLRPHAARRVARLRVVARLTGGRPLAEIADRVEKDNVNPQPRSGQQEYLENLINRFV